MNKKTILAGFAIFAMFFGSGNVVFPLALGRLAGDTWFLAMLGFFMTAVFLPFLGLAAIVLLKGKNRPFFDLIGKYPGTILLLFILALVGPFGVIPRCIGVSYGAYKIACSSTPEWLFSLIFCAGIALFTLQQDRLIPLIGKVLTPVKLGLIAIVIVLGLYFAPTFQPAHCIPMETIKSGVFFGYQTMDLIGSLLFASAIMGYFENTSDSKKSQEKDLLKQGLLASLVGASLLTVVYMSFLCLGAAYADVTCHLPDHEILPTIAKHALGDKASVLFSATIIFSCLTTAVALMGCWLKELSAFEVVRKIPSKLFLFVSLAITFGMSSLGFSGIIKLMFPMLQVLYPILIVMTIIHIIRQLKIQGRK